MQIIRLLHGLLQMLIKATVDASTGAVTVKATGDVTITATSTGMVVM